MNQNCILNVDNPETNKRLVEILTLSKIYRMFSLKYLFSLHNSFKLPDQQLHINLLKHSNV